MIAALRAVTKRLGALPPDPDDMNQTRSGLARDVLLFFCTHAHVDMEDALADFLTDVMHWCDRNNTEFEAELARARINYDEETTVE